MMDKFTGNSATRYGDKTDPEARCAYETSTGNKVLQVGLVVSPKIPWLACSPDGLVQCNSTWKLLEIKCPASQAIKKIVGRENSLLYFI